jgi:hypothetical protein
MATENQHLVKAAFDRAEKRHGKAKHLLSRAAWEALVKAEAFDIIMGQVDESQSMVRYANAIQRALSDEK